MEKKKKVVPIWLSVIFICLLAVSVVRAILFIPQNASQGLSWVFIVIKVLECLTFLFALVYCLTGYKKNSAIHFKLFCLTYALYAGATIYGKFIYITYSFATIASIVTAVVVFGMLVIITFVKNFGKINSLMLALVVVGCETVNVFLSLSMDLSYIITLIGKVVLAVVFTLMVYAKYLDKTARGTK